MTPALLLLSALCADPSTQGNVQDDDETAELVSAPARSNPARTWSLWIMSTGASFVTSGVAMLLGLPLALAALGMFVGPTLREHPSQLLLAPLVLASLFFLAAPCSAVAGTAVGWLMFTPALRKSAWSLVGIPSTIAACLGVVTFLAGIAALFPVAFALGFAGVMLDFRSQQPGAFGTELPLPVMVLLLGSVVALVGAFAMPLTLPWVVPVVSAISTAAGLGIAGAFASPG